MDISVSAIVPFYCTPEDLFCRCLDSLLSDGLAEELEILVIDDGSPAPKADILKQWESVPGVRVIYAPHAGVSAARNRGIREARGRWITFVDSDDFLEAETFRQICREADSFSGDVELFTGGLYHDGAITPNTTFLKEGYNYAADDNDRNAIMESALSAGILPEGYIQMFSLGAPYCKLIRRDFLEKNSLSFDESVKFAEDTLFLLHVYDRAERVYFHNRFLYYYVSNSNSVTRKYRPGLSDDVSVFFDRIAAFLSDSHREKALERGYYARAQFEAGRCFAKEFFHRQNTDPDAKKKYKTFIAKKPFREAFRREYLPKGKVRQRIFRFLVKHGCGRIFRFVDRIKNRG